MDHRPDRLCASRNCIRSTARRGTRAGRVCGGGMGGPGAAARGGVRGRVILRHTGIPAYRCFLPDLTGFTGSGCTGPNPSRHTTRQMAAFDRFQPRARTGHPGRSTAAPEPWMKRPGAGAVKRLRMAEREGFEPSAQLPMHSISSAAPSTTRTPLRGSPMSIPSHGDQAPQQTAVRTRWSGQKRPGTVRARMAEREGFEPPMSFPIPDFESGAFDQPRPSLHKKTRVPRQKHRATAAAA